MMKEGQIDRDKVENVGQWNMRKYRRKCERIRVPREEIKATRYRCKDGEHLVLTSEGVKIISPRR